MDWALAQARLRGPAFLPMTPFLDRLDPVQWPSRDELNALAGGIVTSQGRPLRFVPPRTQREADMPSYELRIAASGEVETRPENWHDLFNALVWLAFPKAKAAINAQHAAILQAGGEAEARRRSPPRDALALFDEGGIVVASSSPGLLQCIRDFAWKALFWHSRRELERRVVFLAFGHALLEKMLDPFAGIVAKAVLLPVDDDFAQLPATARVTRADDLLAAHFAQASRFATPRALPPLPVLGIPGWHPDNVREEYYDDRSHFREKPGGRPGMQP